MKKETRIGFIGYGNMAQAIAKGLLDSGACQGSQICACAGHFDRLCKNAEKMGIRPMHNAKEVAEGADLVIIAVKPGLVESVAVPIRELLEGKIVVSIAAGYGFEKYEDILGGKVHHISTIPNTPVSVGEGIFVCEERHSLTEEEFEKFTELFGKIALIEMVEPSLLSIAGTISGCTPAYTAMYLEALADAGVKHGLSRDAAYRMAAKMIAGTGKMCLAAETHPGVLKDAVCSPGGSTIRGVAALEKTGFRGSVIGAVDAAEGE